MESRAHYLKELADRRVLLASVLEEVKGKPRTWNIGDVWAQQVNEIRHKLSLLQYDHEVRAIRAEVRFFGEYDR